MVNLLYGSFEVIVVFEDVSPLFVDASRREVGLALEL
jgi:hypothetical protein